MSNDVISLLFKQLLYSAECAWSYWSIENHFSLRAAAFVLLHICFDALIDLFRGSEVWSGDCRGAEQPAMVCTEWSSILRLLSSTMPSYRFICAPPTWHWKAWAGGRRQWRYLIEMPSCMCVSHFHSIVRFHNTQKSGENISHTFRRTITNRKDDCTEITPKSCSESVTDCVHLVQSGFLSPRRSRWTEVFHCTGVIICKRETSVFGASNTQTNQ